MFDYPLPESRRNEIMIPGGVLLVAKLFHFQPSRRYLV
jgi:hypothetical protein